MKRINIKNTTITVTFLSLSILGIYYPKTAVKPEEHLKKEIVKTTNPIQAPHAEHIKNKSVVVLNKEVAVLVTNPTKISQHQPTKKIVIHNQGANKLSLTQISYDKLPGWDKANLKKSLSAFQLSCKTFIKQKPNHAVGSQHLNIKAGDWQPACLAALEVNDISEENARSFFEKWFHPIEFEQKKPAPGLFTGYYMPQMKGSLTRTANFTTPIYGLPKHLSLNKFTREAIDNGALKKKAPVIAWIKSPVDRLFLEIEGSGVIKLTNGKSIYLGYAGENGAPYTSIGSVLIRKGIMTRDNASKPAIKRYLETHPKIADDILHKNKSFVFFESLKEQMALGAQGMALTPGYSLAVDKRWIPLGAPLYLDTNKPEGKQEKEQHMQRLMIAQDTGGAIRGLMRGDIYWGSGKIASFLGEHMKNKGHYWLLLPKSVFNKLAG